MTKSDACAQKPGPGLIDPSEGWGRRRTRVENLAGVQLPNPTRQLALCIYEYRRFLCSWPHPYPALIFWCVPFGPDRLCWGQPEHLP